jgi:hypothetical protein
MKLYIKNMVADTVMVVKQLENWNQPLSVNLGEVSRVKRKVSKDKITTVGCCIKIVETSKSLTTKKVKPLKK